MPALDNHFFHECFHEIDIVMSSPLAFYLGMLVGCFLGVLGISMLILARRADDKLGSPTYDRGRDTHTGLSETVDQNDNNR